MENCDTSCEPMDVDLSINSINKSFNETQRATSPAVMDVSDIATSLEYQKVKSEDEIPSKPRVWNVKTYNINMNKNKHTSHRGGLYFTLLVLATSAFLFYAFDLQCCDNLDLKELHVKLNNRLFGQNIAMNALLESLEADFNSKILFLYGGTGVGKTFTTTIMLEDYWNSTNVYHFTMPSFVNSFTSQTMLGMNLCKSSIVVVDDVKVNDVHVKKLIQEVIKRSEDLKKKITVILIYNCDAVKNDLTKKCDVSFYTELAKVFEDVNVCKKFIKYEPLSQDILKKCIENEMGGKAIHLKYAHNIFNNFDVSRDGCKGVYKKMKLMRYEAKFSLR